MVSILPTIFICTYRKSVRIACYPAGHTPVAIKDGMRPIEEIEMGDWVYAYNEETGETALRQVLGTVQREVDSIVEISLGEEKIRTTPEHPFYINGQWKAAGELEVGEMVTTMVSTWLYTAIGDVYFVGQDYDLALDAYTTVLKCPDGISNPYTWLMIGQSHYEMDQYEKAKEHLLRAYMLDGKDIFAGEDTKYFKLIESLVDEE